MSGRILIYNRTRPETDPVPAFRCTSFVCRLRGLMFRRKLPNGEGLLLVQSRDSRIDSSIHMLFMFMDLAAVWINSAYRVVDVRIARRWTPAYFPRDAARYVLETDPAHLGKFVVGDQLEFEEKSSL